MKHHHQPTQNFYDPAITTCLLTKVLGHISLAYAADSRQHIWPSFVIPPPSLALSRKPSQGPPSCVSPEACLLLTVEDIAFGRKACQAGFRPSVPLLGWCPMACVKTLSSSGHVSSPHTSICSGWEGVPSNPTGDISMFIVCCSLQVTPERKTMLKTQGGPITLDIYSLEGSCSAIRNLAAQNGMCTGHGTHSKSIFGTEG